MKREANQAPRAQLVASYVSQKAAHFLESHYEEWYATYGMNAAIDPAAPLDDVLRRTMRETQKEKEGPYTYKE